LYNYNLNCNEKNFSNNIPGSFHSGIGLSKPECHRPEPNWIFDHFSTVIGFLDCHEVWDIIGGCKKLGTISNVLTFRLYIFYLSYPLHTVLMFLQWTISKEWTKFKEEYVFPFLVSCNCKEWTKFKEEHVLRTMQVF
jgi:hypothetical protein